MSESEKLDADFQCVHFLRWSEENFIFTTWICVDSDEDYEQAEMKGLFTLGSRLANRSHRQSGVCQFSCCIIHLDAMIRRLGGRNK
ncbi:hypothetical protein T4D_12119 [Trichinella pseudospiralis]|uniref:Uncharacterized protein n=1 Tax=Trichinella pseudospiralis TaxID=6337 RepID=A0A0V1FGZ3_TRIPS|nr:hypothetical protein T4D_12119 [Trichinella pseudospiralis]